MSEQIPPVYVPPEDIIVFGEKTITSFSGSTLDTHTFESLGVDYNGTVTAIEVREVTLAQNETLYHLSTVLDEHGHGAFIWPKWQVEFAGDATRFASDLAHPVKTCAGAATDFSAYAKVRFGEDRESVLTSFAIRGANPNDALCSALVLAFWGIPNPPPKSPFPEVDW